VDLSIVLVNFNDGPRLRACLASLAQNPPAAEHEILVVDNASTDGSPDAVRREFPAVRVLANPVNAGFSAANNRGVAEGRGPFLLFLNTDTIVPAGALDALLTRVASDASVGAVGPALIHAPGDYQVSFGNRVGFFAQIFQKLVVNPHVKRALRRGAGRAAKNEREVGWLSAACLLCRREAFERAGGFDERFFIYFEDIDLCARIRAVGWRLRFIPSVEVRHEGGATTTATPERRAASRLEYRRSQARYYRKHASRASRLLLGASLRMNVAFLRLRGAFRGKAGRALAEGYRRLLRGEEGP
jgi:N-acetylglucosaminyl-diphospho-decaprenol L-rhamnosyltransferase